MVTEILDVYLAARFSRRNELKGYRALLHEAGHRCTAQWLDEADGETFETTSTIDRAEYAVRDMSDILVSDIVVVFTEPRKSVLTGAGKYVEQGYALGLGKAIVFVVGEAENVFAEFPGIIRCDNFLQVMARLEAGYYTLARHCADNMRDWARAADRRREQAS